MGSLATADVADLGCGGGRFGLAFARAGHSVHFVDASETMLDLARVRCAKGTDMDLRFTHGDATTTLRQDPTEYDFVLALGELLAYVESPSRFLGMVSRRLRPGGCLFGTYMRRPEMLRRLSGGEVLADDGLSTVFIERRGVGDIPDLVARAHEDTVVETTLISAALVPAHAPTAPEGPVGSFIAVHH